MLKLKRARSTFAVLTAGNGGEVHLLLGGAGGGLAKDSTLMVAYASGVASGDFNGDGVRDLAVTQSSKVNGTPDSSLSVWR